MKLHFTIGEAAKYLGISVEAIRFYEKKGIIPPFIRGENNYRLITHSHLLYLKGVVQLKEAGFKLEEIKRIHENKLNNHFELLNKGIQNINEEIAKLEKTKENLAKTISELKSFYSLIEKGIFIKKVKGKLKTTNLNELNVNHLLSDEDMIFSLTKINPISSSYLIKAFTYKEESDIEKEIEDMRLYGKKNHLNFNGSIFLNIVSAASYYTGDSLAAILYMNLEE